LSTKIVPMVRIPPSPPEIAATSGHRWAIAGAFPGNPCRQIPPAGRAFFRAMRPPYLGTLPTPKFRFLALPKGLPAASPKNAPATVSRALRGALFTVYPLSRGRISLKTRSREVTPTAMTRSEELRDQAEQCARLARTVVTPGLADALRAQALNYLERATKLDLPSPVAQQQQQVQPEK
jgi:hypothetical protein